MTNTTSDSPRGAMTSVWSAIALLALLNLGLVGFIFFSHNNDEDKHGKGDKRLHGEMRPELGQRGGPFGMIVHETQMDEQQIDKYEQLRDEHRDAVAMIRAQMAEHRRRVYASLGTVNSQQLNSALDTIASLQRSIDSVTITHFRDVRNILRPEQAQRFDSIMPEAIQMMSPPLPGRKP